MLVDPIRVLHPRLVHGLTRVTRSTSAWVGVTSALLGRSGGDPIYAAPTGGFRLALSLPCKTTAPAVQ